MWGEEIKVLGEEISFRSSEGCLLEMGELNSEVGTYLYIERLFCLTGYRMHVCVHGHVRYYLWVFWDVFNDENL